jgi:hypothetical protein
MQGTQTDVRRVPYYRVVRISQEGDVVIFDQDRHELRKMYANAWQKHIDGTPMSPLDAQIATVVEQHPEYHAAVTNDDLDQDYAPEGGKTNPFLHMGLHLSIREQVATNRPPGITTLYAKIAAKAGDPHMAEHQMIECLAETLWEAQSRDGTPNEAEYLDRLRRL